MNREELFEIFCHMPVLETARLRLRAMHPSDALDMYDYAKSLEVTRYLLWSAHPSVAYTKQYLSYVEARYAMGDFYDWAITQKESGRMIGTCGFTAIDLPNRSAELGYVLHPAYHGRGLATEAAGEVLRLGFGGLGLHRIEARYMEGNEASTHVMERLGMRHEGLRRDALFVKGAFRTVGTYAILREEYCV